MSERLIAALDGQYKIIREAGAGGMATVYLAEDLKHGRQVALKVLRPELAATLGPVRFFREIQVAARLQHPHILPLHDSGEAGGFLYYVMPFVDGESLRERLARVGELPIHDAVKILMEVVDALAYAHGQGVVHRDIKPDNVMLSGRHALVTDFGVAKAVSEATGKNALTTAGVALGTPSYMAPEQAAADPHLDHRVDIYAVGAMAYELLTGRPPFIGMTPQQVLAAHVTQAPDPVTRYRAAVPPQLEAVIMRCLAKRASDRWQTAEELLQNLEPLATPSGGMTPTSTRPIQGVTLATTVTGRRWIYGVAAAVVALIGTLGWFAFRGRNVQVIQPDRIQVTYTGNAYSPGLSPDGQRLAYVSRHCPSVGTCTFDLVIQDVGGAGINTVLSGWAWFSDVEWTADGRHLLFMAIEAKTGRWGPVTIPSLGGGTPRWLGCCNARMANGDTAILTRGAFGDPVNWILRVSLSDLVATDSFAIPAGKGQHVAWPLGTDGKLLIGRSASGVAFLLTTTRDGRPIDSVDVSGPQLQGLTVDEGGRAVLLGHRRPDVIGEYDLLALRVSESGRFAPKFDTIIRGLRGSIPTGRNGMVVYASGLPRYELRTMRPTGRGALQFSERLLTTSTVPVSGTLSDDGKQVVMARQVVQGGKALTQLSVMPSDSGAETLVGRPADIADWGWRRDDKALLMAVRSGDSIVLSELELGAQRTRPVTTMHRGSFDGFWSLPGGGVVVLDPDARTLHVRAIPGRADTSYSLPEAMGRIDEVAPSPDGRALIASGWDRSYDSLVVRRLDLPEGRFTHLWAVLSDGGMAPRWLNDGNIIVPVLDAGATPAWYRLPASGGRAVRLGSPPHGGEATFRWSADGRVVIARIQTVDPDIYLIRNFKQLLGE